MRSGRKWRRVSIGSGDEVSGDSDVLELSALEKAGEEIGNK